MEPFDLLGPLPAEHSTTVLQASAGTGKTFALAGLVTRYLAEGAATLDQMLLITFSRAASQELRERVRRQSISSQVNRTPAMAVELRQVKPGQGLDGPAIVASYWSLTCPKIEGALAGSVGSVGSTPLSAVLSALNDWATSSP